LGLPGLLGACPGLRCRFAPRCLFCFSTPFHSIIAVFAEGVDLDCLDKNTIGTLTYRCKEHFLNPVGKLNFFYRKNALLKNNLAIKTRAAISAVVFVLGLSWGTACAQTNLRCQREL